MSIFGSAPVFDCKSDEWAVHKAQMKNFFEANDISSTSDAKGTKRRAILLNCMSQDSYRLARDLLFPETPETAAYPSILEKLDAHFGPKKCTYAEREKFYSANKETYESMMEYAARLRGLSSGCEFGTALEMCLTDRFVLGIDSKGVREKLYREDAMQLKMARALELASAIESSQNISASTSCVKTEPLMYSGVRRASGVGGGGAGAGAARREQPRAGSIGRCTVCGARAHHAADCGYRNLCCDNCGVKGHLKRMCTKKSGDNSFRKNRAGSRE